MPERATGWSGRSDLFVWASIALAMVIAGCGSDTSERDAFLSKRAMLGRELAMGLTYDQLAAPDVANLLSQGADPNVRTPQRSTPTPLGSRSSALMAAAYFGHADIVELLLRAGANPCETDERGTDVRWFAAEGGRAFAERPRRHDGVQYLLQGAVCR